jgi:DNA repair protein RecN (Recombination protein N)
MLLELKVTNFAIIENLHIQFKTGLNILSGETGAGKSVLLKSLGLLMGQKGSTESIRSGCEQASIEGFFDISQRKDLQKKLDDLGIENDENVLVVRRVLSEDKSRVYLNGSLNTLNALRDLVAPLIEVAGHTAPLIEMTGQHENRSLLSKSYHLDLLDQYVGAMTERSVYLEKYQRASTLKTEISKLESELQTKAQRLDFLIYQRNEIKKLNLDAEADANLEIEIKKLKSSARLTSFVDMAENTLVGDDDSASQRLKLILQRSSEIAQLDPVLANKIENLQQAKVLIEDTAYELRLYLTSMDSDSGRLEELESRLSDLRKVQKKYGTDISEILMSFRLMETEISSLENSDQKIVELKAELLSLDKELQKMADSLHKKRSNGAKVLTESVNAELGDLNMKGVTFHVSVERLTELCSTGFSDVEFMSQTSSKDPRRPLSKFASGGELSRILLSLKRVVGFSGQPRTYLFDEVDTGVSGPTAEKVGKKLRSIAKGQQVICVTHLPQVAAYGDAHFFIQKSPQKGSVTMVIEELKKKERVSEIARLISGEKISKTSLAHAEQLLSEAR